MRALKIVKRLVVAAILLAAIAMAFLWARSNPEDLPWTQLDLADPVGAFTGRKLSRLTGDTPLCRNLLDDAGIAYEALPPRDSGPNCSYSDATRPTAASGPQQVVLAPTDVTISCPVVAALSLWEWHSLQPAAIEHLGSPVARIEHYGGYSCRRMYGAETGRWSEHATADALDIAAFVTEDGRRVSVVSGWNGEADEQAFLRDVRDGACDLFATVLSPDYNAAHADHFHLDMAQRGGMGGGVCR